MLLHILHQYTQYKGSAGREGGTWDILEKGMVVLVDRFDEPIHKIASSFIHIIYRLLVKLELP
jgi:hypothetical protein